MAGAVEGNGIWLAAAKQYESPSGAVAALEAKPLNVTELLSAAMAIHQPTPGITVEVKLIVCKPVPGEATEPVVAIRLPGPPVEFGAYKAMQMLPDELAMLTVTLLEELPHVVSLV